MKTLYCATPSQDEGRWAVTVKLCSSWCCGSNLTLVACPVAFSLCFTVTSYVPFSTHCKDYHPSAFATLKKKRKKKCSNTTEIKCPHFTLMGDSWRLWMDDVWGCQTEVPLNPLNECCKCWRLNIKGIRKFVIKNEICYEIWTIRRCGQCEVKKKTILKLNYIV